MKPSNPYDKLTPKQKQDLDKFCEQFHHLQDAQMNEYYDDIYDRYVPILQICKCKNGVLCKKCSDVEMAYYMNYEEDLEELDGVQELGWMVKYSLF